MYNELIYNDYTVNVGAFESIEKDKNGKSIRKNNEIDFYAKKYNRIYYIISLVSDLLLSITFICHYRLCS